MMDEKTARKILTDEDCITANDSLFCYGPFIDWPLELESNDVIELDGCFTIELLETMIWWMKNMKVGVEWNETD